MRAPVCVAQPRERLSEPSVQRSTADGARPTDCGCRGLTGQVSCAGNSAARTTITDSIAEWVHSSISDSIAEFHLNVALGATSFFEILAKSGSLVRSCVLTSAGAARPMCVHRAGAAAQGACGHSIDAQRRSPDRGLVARSLVSWRGKRRKTPVQRLRSPEPGQAHGIGRGGEERTDAATDSMLLEPAPQTVTYPSPEAASDHASPPRTVLFCRGSK
jgi:hypothetical protein